MSHPLDHYTIQSVQSFLNEVFNNLDSTRLDVSSFELDHICYRVETHERYMEFRKVLRDHGNLLVESHVNGRPISIFKLFKPIVFDEREVYIFELPAPKEGSLYKEGYEHVEFVTLFTLEELMLKYPELYFDKKDLAKDLNRDIRLSFGNISVKFHEASLEKIIGVEGNA